MSINTTTQTNVTDATAPETPKQPEVTKYAYDKAYSLYEMTGNLNGCAKAGAIFGMIILHLTGIGAIISLVSIGVAKGINAKRVTPFASDATKIQKAARDFLARKRVKNMKEAAAAATIQRAVSGFIVRKKTAQVSKVTKITVDLSDLHVGTANAQLIAQENKEKGSANKLMASQEAKAAAEKKAQIRARILKARKARAAGEAAHVAKAEANKPFNKAKAAIENANRLREAKLAAHRGVSDLTKARKAHFTAFLEAQKLAKLVVPSDRKGLPKLEGSNPKLKPCFKSVMSS